MWLEKFSYSKKTINSSTLTYFFKLNMKKSVFGRQKKLVGNQASVQVYCEITSNCKRNPTPKLQNNFCLPRKIAFKEPSGIRSQKGLSRILPSKRCSWKTLQPFKICQENFLLQEIDNRLHLIQRGTCRRLYTI